MAKQVLLDALEKSIGKYVLNLDSDALNVALWKGKIELNALQLNVEAVNTELAHATPPIPFRVQAGHFERFQVKVPWTSLMSKPVQFQAQGLNVQIAVDAAAVESNDSNHDLFLELPSSSSLIRIAEARSQALAQAEERRLQANALRKLVTTSQQNTTTTLEKEDATTKTASASFGAKLLRRILENLQVEIRSVHISLVNQYASAGVVLESLLLVTTDERGTPTFVDRTKQSSSLHKILTITGLGMYLDEIKDDLSENLSRFTSTKSSGRDKAQNLTSIQEDHSVTAAKAVDHTFVLAPLSLEAKLKQADGNLNDNFPKYSLEADLKSLDINWTQTQVTLAQKLVKHILQEPSSSTPNESQLIPLFPEYRPMVRPRLSDPSVGGRVWRQPSGAAQWWHYAHRCINRLNGRGLWMEFLRAYRIRKEYIQLYKRHAYSPKARDASPSTLQQKKKGKTPPTKRGPAAKRPPGASGATAAETGLPWIKPLSDDELERLSQLEQDRSISLEGIMMWRNIADAQIEKEKQVHAKELLLAILGESSSETVEAQQKTTTTTISSDSSDNHELDSASDNLLSIQEIQELESSTMEQDELFAKPGREGKLYDLKFVLKSLNIYLKKRLALSGSNRSGSSLFALLAMDTVSTGLQANANGAYEYHLTMSSLTIQDKATSRSLFPTVLQKCQARDEQQAFVLRFDKTKTEDLRLQVTLATFEAVASPAWIKEVKDFFTLDGTFPAKTAVVKRSSIVSQLTGAFARSQSTYALDLPNVSKRTSRLAPGVLNSFVERDLDQQQMEDVGKALLDAWKLRSENRSLLSLKLDISAPILIVPENCSDTEAKALVLDMGHVKLNYGSNMALNSPNVTDWFIANPQHSAINVAPVLDFGMLSLRSLSFRIGSVTDSRTIRKQHSESFDEEITVVQPISVTIDFGVEATGSEGFPRACVFAVLPSIGIAISKEQMGDALRVYHVFAKIFSGTKAESSRFDAFGTAVRPDDDSSIATAASWILGEGQKSPAVSSSTPNGCKQQKKFHVDMRLRRLSCKIGTKDGRQGVEAHLVSVGSTFSSYSNGAITSRLTMGWFWVTDDFQYDFPRQQRLIVHSSLPSRAATAGASLYDIMSVLNRLGVFSDSYAGSVSDLADIEFQYSPDSLIGKFDPLQQNLLSSSNRDIAANTLVDAKFSSLLVNWNPQAIKEMLDGLAQLTGYVKLASQPKKPKSSNRFQYPSETTIQLGFQGGQIRTDNNGPSDSVFVLRARLECVELCLRSSLDDLPIFTLAMNSADASYVRHTDKGSILRAALGDLTITTPNTGRTHELYRCLLGRPPGETSSCVSICYAEGQAVLETINDPTLANTSSGDLASWGLVTMSPVRIVCIFSQVMGLVDQVTRGILGTLTSKAGSSAAAAAAEMASSGLQRKAFWLRATAFEVLVPEAAWDENNTRLTTGTLVAKYTALPGSGGGEAELSLFDLRIRDRDGSILCNETSVSFDLTAQLPNKGIDSQDDQPLRVVTRIPNSSFVLLKCQYDRILSTLDKNLGEPDMFLRDRFFSGDKEDDRSVSKDIVLQALEEESTEESSVLTEGAQLTFCITFNTLSLDLFGADKEDHIFKLQATGTGVTMKSGPNIANFALEVTLDDLLCTDERPAALGRSERALVSRDPDSSGYGKLFSFFKYSYETTGAEKADITLSFGAPRIVLVPDTIGELQRFFVHEGQAKTKKRDEGGKKVNLQVNESVDGSLEIEVSADPVCYLSVVRTTALSYTTGPFSLVLLDLGSTALAADLAGERKPQFASASEIIVCKGSVKIQGNMVSRVSDGKVVSGKAQIDGVKCEIYTSFGRNTSAVQILDPFNYSIYGFAKNLDGTCPLVDIRFVALAPIDICCSMQNVALANAILSSVNENLGQQKNNKQPGTLISCDAQLIENLDRSLQKAAREVTLKSLISPHDSVVQHDTNTSSVEREIKLTVKMSLTDLEVTFVNDLLGLDEALIRIGLANLVASAHVKEGERVQPGLKCYTGFDVKFNCSLVAAYFDHSSESWEDFLLKPLEVNFRAKRGRNWKQSPDRPNTFVDFELLPLDILMTQQLLSSLASATNTWSVYERTMSSLNESVESSSAAGSLQSAKANSAATAARSLIVSQPYGIENISGFDIEFELNRSSSSGQEVRLCRNGLILFFRFSLPKSNGSGGKRFYGKEASSFAKCVGIRVVGSTHWIEIENLDNELEGGKRKHTLQNSLFLFTEVLRQGKTKVVCLSSGVVVHGRTAVPLSISLPSLSASKQNDPVEIGICRMSHRGTKSSFGSWPSKLSSKVGLPADAVQLNHKTGTYEWNIFVSPNKERDKGVLLQGCLSFHQPLLDVEGKHVLDTEIVCNPVAGKGSVPDVPDERCADPFVIHARIIFTAINELHTCVDIYLEPRTRIENRLPVDVTVFIPAACGRIVGHSLQPNESIDIYSCGQSINVGIRCTNQPEEGTHNDLVDGIKLPLGRGARLLDPVRLCFPFATGPGGSEFFVVDGEQSLAELSSFAEKKQESDWIHTDTVQDGVKTFFIAVCNYAVDHTGATLFELLGDGETFLSTAPISDVGVNESSLFGLIPDGGVRHSSVSKDMIKVTGSVLLGAYKSSLHPGRRVSHLPASFSCVFRLRHKTGEMERASEPFLIDDVSIFDGGATSTRVLWENGKPSGLFMYRTLEHAFQSVIHVVPEFVVFNGSKKYAVRVRQLQGAEFLLDPQGKIIPLQRTSGEEATVSLEWNDFDGLTAPLNVEELGLRVAVVRKSDGLAIGSVAIETVLGRKDSRLVVSIGEPRFGADAYVKSNFFSKNSIMENDWLRTRLQLAGLRMKVLARQKEVDPGIRQKERGKGTGICSVLLERVTLDWQRIFKPAQVKRWGVFGTKAPTRTPSLERSQLSVIIQDMRIMDDTPGSDIPIVFDSSSKNHFFDLCIRFKGPLGSAIVKVELIDLNLAHAIDTNKSDEMILSASEEFVWRLLDLADAIQEASAEFSPADVKLQWDEEKKIYKVQILEETASSLRKPVVERVGYSAPKSDMLFAIDQIRLSPFIIRFSFQRTPVHSRYGGSVAMGSGAGLMYYFTERLQFKIDSASLDFSKYEAIDIKGNLSRIVEIISGVYMTRIKLKFFTLMSAGKDWKLLGSGHTENKGQKGGKK